MPILRAHGQLGIWDELIFLGITVVFGLIMVFSWLRSRNLADADEEGMKKRRRRANTSAWTERALAAVCGAGTLAQARGDGSGMQDVLVDVVLPNLGFGMEEGQLLAWLKAPGEVVRKGEALAEIEGDKTTVELEALAEGVLEESLVPAGATVPVGTVLARIRSAAAASLKWRRPCPKRCAKWPRRRRLRRLPRRSSLPKCWRRRQCGDWRGNRALRWRRLMAVAATDA